MGMNPTTNRNVPVIAVDTGNKLMKTPHFIFSAGLSSHGEHEPASIEPVEFLRRDRTYYTVSEQHISNVPDKTKDEQYVNLTLIAIAKELLLNDITPDYDGVVRTHIVLCLGLPINHYDKYRRNYTSFYKGRQFVFSYRPEGTKRITKFDIVADRVYVFPQGFAACQSSKEIMRMTRDGICNVIDIGGYTTDIVQLENGRPVMSDTISPTLNSVGFNNLVAKINRSIEAKTEARLRDSQIDQIIRSCGQDCGRVYKPVVDEVLRITREYARDIVGRLVEEGVRFQFESIVFVGGGALCLKPFIEEAIHARFGSNASVKFVTELRANAIGYYVLGCSMEQQRS